MFITFRIHYNTCWGEELFVKMADTFTSLKMDYSDGGWWSHTLTVNDDGCELHYTYQVRTDGIPSREESLGTCHVFSAKGGVEHYLVVDRWIDEPDYSPSQPATLTQSFFDNCQSKTKSLLRSGDLQLTVRMTGVMPSHAVAIVGAGEQLGDWNPAHATILDNEFDDCWSIVLHQAVGRPLEFKLLVVDRDSRSLVAWERGDNHHFDTGESSVSVVVINDIVVDHPLRPQREVGTRVALSRVRSERDMGCGDFKDLAKLLSWQAKTVQTCLVLAPLNDTSVHGSWYTFKAINACSLHPAYLAVDAVGALHDKELAALYHQRAIALNRRKTIDMYDVAKLKLQLLADIFKQHAETIIAQRDFKRFVTDNLFWLKPYAAYVMLRQVKGSDDVTTWGDYARYNDELVTRFLDARNIQTYFVYFVQYQLRLQLREAYDKACENGIVIAFDALDATPSSRRTVVDMTSWLAAVSRLAQPDNANDNAHRLTASLEAIIASTDLNRGVKTLVQQLLQTNGR